MYIYDWPGDEGVNSDVHIYSYIVPGGGGGTQCAKGYRLWSDRWRVVAVATRNC